MSENVATGAKTTAAPPLPPKLQPQSPQPPNLFWIRTNYDFVSSHTTDLTFREGDILAITDVSSSHWWGALNITGETGLIPANYVQVLPQYSGASISGELMLDLKGFRIEKHESSPFAVEVWFNTFHANGESVVKAQRLVKTISQISQFAREISRIFPEAGLPLDLTSHSNWVVLISSLHAFNSSKTAESAQAFLQSVAGFDTMNGMVFTWLLPGAEANQIKNEIKTKSIVTINHGQIGNEAVVLHNWDGDEKNGELTKLSIGDHIIVLHEQNDWVFCRRSPESPDTGYVPLQYLRKLTVNVNRQDGKAPVLPVKMKPMKKAQTDDDFDTPLNSPIIPSITVKRFSLKSLAAFDQLVEEGLTVEKNDNCINFDDPTSSEYIADRVSVTPGCTVTLSCNAMKWEPSGGVARTFATTFPTEDDSIGEHLTFLVGSDHVTEALDTGVQMLKVGDEATIVGCPEKCYAAAGLAGLVNSSTFLIYEVKILEVVVRGSIDCRGPDALIKARTKARTNSNRKILGEPLSVRTDEGIDVTNRDRTSTQELLDQVQEQGLIMGMGGSVGSPVSVELRHVKSLEEEEEEKAVLSPLSKMNLSSPPPTKKPPTLSPTTQAARVALALPPPILPSTLLRKKSSGTLSDSPPSPSDKLLSPVSAALGAGKRNGSFRTGLVKKKSESKIVS